MKLKKFVWISGLVSVLVCSFASLFTVLNWPYSGHLYLVGIAVFIIFITALLVQVARS